MQALDQSSASAARDEGPTPYYLFGQTGVTRPCPILALRCQRKSSAMGQMHVTKISHLPELVFNYLPPSPYDGRAAVPFGSRCRPCDRSVGSEYGGHTGACPALFTGGIKGHSHIMRYRDVARGIRRTIWRTTDNSPESPSISTRSARTIDSTANNFRCSRL